MGSRPRLIAGDRSSVMVACNGAPGALGRCLGAVPPLTGAELILCSAVGAARRAAGRLPAAVWLVRTMRSSRHSGATASTRRRARSSRSRSRRCPAGRLDRALRAALADARRDRRRDRAGGRPAARRPRGVLLPLRARHAAVRGARERSTSRGQRRLPARRLLAVDESWRDGFWEKVVHAPLAARGDRLGTRRPRRRDGRSAGAARVRPPATRSTAGCTATAGRAERPGANLARSRCRPSSRS